MVEFSPHGRSVHGRLLVKITTLTFLILAAATVYLATYGVRFQATLRSSQIEAAPDGGYVALLHPPRWPMSVAENRDRLETGRSVLRLMDDELALQGATGSAIAPGTYQHCCGYQLFFLPIDGSDPRLNGRTYRVTSAQVLNAGTARRLVILLMTLLAACFLVVRYYRLALGWAHYFLGAARTAAASAARWSGTRVSVGFMRLRQWIAAFAGVLDRASARLDRGLRRAAGRLASLRAALPTRRQVAAHFRRLGGQAATAARRITMPLIQVAAAAGVFWIIHLAAARELSQAGRWAVFLLLALPAAAILLSSYRTLSLALILAGLLIGVDAFDRTKYALIYDHAHLLDLLVLWEYVRNGDAVLVVQYQDLVVNVALVLGLAICILIAALWIENRASKRSFYAFRGSRVGALLVAAIALLNAAVFFQSNYFLGCLQPASLRPHQTIGARDRFTTAVVRRRPQPCQR